MEQQDMEPLANIADDAPAVRKPLLGLTLRQLRLVCDEAGLKGIPLLVGGNIVIGKQTFEDVEKRFREMGFDRAFPPNTPPETTIEALRELLGMDGEGA